MEGIPGPDHLVVPGFSRVQPIPMRQNVPNVVTVTFDDMAQQYPLLLADLAGICDNEHPSNENLLLSSKYIVGY
jgi:hypothetical protein